MSLFNLAGYYSSGYVPLPYLGMGSLGALADPIQIAAKVLAGQKLDRLEYAVWKALAPEARDAFRSLASAQPGTKGAAIPPPTVLPPPPPKSWFEQSTELFGMKIQNTYLAVGGGLAAALVVFRMMKRK